MRFLASLLLCAGVGLAGAGCDKVDRKLFSEGIGSDLYTADIADVAKQQDDYIASICDQAGFVRDKKGRVCSTGDYVVSDTVWSQFVQAGMNDIDRRCDAYLVWLDHIRRSEAPNLKLLSDAHTATQLVLEATSAGVTPMAIAAVAFGFAADALTNINSRLILQVNQSTVQAVVLSRQKEYRRDLLGDGKTKPRVVIDNRPAALYALRNYMRLCMPMTIETEINNTIVAYERGGIEALRGERMITAMSVSQPVTAGQRQFRPVRNKVEPLPTDVAPYFEEKKLSEQEGDFVLKGLCLDKNVTDQLSKGELIRELVKIYEATPDFQNTPIKDGIISGRERAAVEKQSDCGEAKNYYERKNFATLKPAQAKTASARALKSLVGFLNRSDKGGKIDDTVTLKDKKLRDKIVAVRLEDERVKSAVEPVDKWFQNQVTPDFMLAIRNLPAPPQPAVQPVQPAPAPNPAPPANR